MTIDAFIHVGHGLYLLSYAVKDILWLRLLTVVAALSIIPAYYYRQEPLLSAIGWELVFVAVNLFWIVRLVRERRPIHLSDEEERLRNLAFPSLSPREIQTLVAFGHWQDSVRGDVLIEEGERLGRLIVLVRGRAKIEVRGEHVADSSDGAFLGEISFLTNSPASARVTADGPLRYVWWSFAELRTFMDRQPALRSLLLMHMGTDVAAKLRDR